MLQVEKDAVESQLRQCQATIASLRAQNRRSREKAARAEGGCVWYRYIIDRCLHAATAIVPNVTQD